MRLSDCQLGDVITLYCNYLGVISEDPTGLAIQATIIGRTFDGETTLLGWKLDETYPNYLRPRSPKCPDYQYLPTEDQYLFSRTINSSCPIARLVIAVSECLCGIHQADCSYHGDS